MNQQQAHKFVRKLKELKELCEESGLGPVVRIQVGDAGPLAVAIHMAFQPIPLSRTGQKNVSRFPPPIRLFNTWVETAPMEEDAKISA